MTRSAIQLQSQPAQRSSFALLLNANAKQVTPRILHALEQVAGREVIFVSHDEAEADDIADFVVSRGYETVFAGGGDGTFVGWVNRILDRAERKALPVPRFGVLALGTGNAMAEVVGARLDGPVADLSAFANGELYRVRSLDLLTCEERRTPFAGVGFDAAVLNDYSWFKNRLGGTILQAMATGAPGYALSVALRSAPRQLFLRRPSYCEIVNVGRPAFRLDGRGRQLGPAIRYGELLYAGPCMMAAASTVPFYGFGLRAFPFADSRPGLLQLRVATAIPLPTLLLNLPSIWAGDFAHPNLLDFHAERVSLQFEPAMPLQVGGDADGWREHVTFGVTPTSIELVDFRRPRRRLRLLS